MKIVKTFPRYLSKYIKMFYSIYASGLDELNDTHCRLPDGTLDIVFNLGSPVFLSRNGIHFSPMPEVALTGLYQEKKFIRYSGTIHLVGVVFQPCFAHLFLEDALQHYKESALDASLVFGKEIFLLSEQMKAFSDEGERHFLLEYYLADRLKKENNSQYAAKIHSVVQYIHEQKRNVDITELYKSNFMSERTFRRRFTECVGMIPKQYSTIIKVKSFSRQYETMRSTYTNALDGLGYTDPSHFIKDFHKIAGFTPTAYFRQLNKIGAEFIHLI